MTPERKTEFQDKLVKLMKEYNVSVHEHEWEDNDGCLHSEYHFNYDGDIEYFDDIGKDIADLLNP